VQSSGKTEVTGANVLAAIFSEQDSQSVYLMRQENVGRLDVINYISHGSTKPRSGMRGDNDQLGGHYMEESDGMQEETTASPLEQYTTNLKCPRKIRHD